LDAGRGGQLSLYSLVKSLADNKQLLGMRYAEWCIAAPTLEADIAAAAMGLDDIGHSRVLYGSLRELGTPDGAADDAANYANVPYLDRPWTEWGEFVAANAVLDTAFTLMIEALANGNVEVLRSRLKKMLQEERYHFLHGRSWMHETTAGTAVDRAWRESLEWFGPENGDVDELHRTGPLAHGVRDLRRLLEERLGGRPPEAAIDWSHWEPIRRRTQAGGIDQATLDMLQGLAEKRYMPAGGG
jgi:1,2-phenylacetyl-CoA epoxidase catalytic subunit